MRFSYVYFLLLPFLLLFCSPPLSGFSAKKIYIADGFNEKTLSGFSIGLGPVLTKQGVDIVDSLNSDEIFKNIRSLRSDLKLIPFNQIKTLLITNSGKNWCDSLFLLLYNEKTLKLQLNDLFWQILPCDFLMIVRVKDAMSIKTFDSLFKKRIRLEAELWNCKEQEVVWRIEVHSIANGKRVSDRQIINESIFKIYEELPKTIPSYENSKW
jgi:hypothetical protein